MRHGGSGTVEYRAWIAMKTRCFNPNAHGGHRYSGRGITMHPAWVHDFVAFRDYLAAALGPRPTPAHSIDRIDNDGHYVPGNLRWATKSEQRRNQPPRPWSGLHL